MGSLSQSAQNFFQTANTVSTLQKFKNLFHRTLKCPETPTFTEVCHEMGYPIEEHKITTKDGYILFFQRIQARNSPQQRLREGLPVVYLQHGLFASATQWISNTEANAIGFMLANKGYDVWCGNSRGNSYSLEHAFYKDNADPRFWDFSMTDMADYDIPAAFEYIAQRTGQKVNYIGHSQGTVVMLAGLVCAQKKLVLENVGRIILLAPFASLIGVSGPAKFILSEKFLKVVKTMGHHKITFGSKYGLKLMGWAASQFKSTASEFI